MKKLIATLLILGAMISGNKIYADGNIRLPSETPAKNTEVTFYNVSEGADLFIKNSEGQTIMSEKINQNGTYTRKFDLSGLAKNEYYFEVDKDGFIVLYPFTVGEQYVDLKEDQMEYIVKPSIHVEGELVYLTRDTESNKPVRIEIYHEGRNVYSEYINPDGTLNRKYNFSSCSSGDYQFTVYYDNRILNESVNIQTLY